MANKVDIPDLQRSTFFPGQRLAEADLTELQRANRELRWLHHRSLHSWGIGIGLAVTGERGDRAVTISPGYGVDCLGREIILSEERTKTVPAVAGGPGGGEAVYFLVAAYQADADQKVVERRSGVCLPEGAVRLSEEPLLDWRQPDQLQEGEELVLAQAWLQHCQLSRPLSLAVRRSARPSQQPYIGAGQTAVGNTPWEPWEVSSQGINPIVGVLIHVNTQAARFSTIPRYVAHVVGDRFLPGAPGPLMVVGFASIVDATRDGFTLQVLLPMLTPDSTSGVAPNPTSLRSAAAPDIFNQLGLHVVWMGIQDLR